MKFGEAPLLYHSNGDQSTELTIARYIRNLSEFALELEHQKIIRTNLRNFFFNFFCDTQGTLKHMLVVRNHRPFEWTDATESNNWRPCHSSSADHRNRGISFSEGKRSVVLLRKGTRIRLWLRMLAFHWLTYIYGRQLLIKATTEHMGLPHWTIFIAAVR